MLISFRTVFKMDAITKSHGLVHVAERIFMLLDYESILKCENVNENWRQILNATNSPKTSFVLKNPWFWFKKCVELDLLPVDHQNDLTKMIQKLGRELIVHYLKTIFEKRPAPEICSPFHVGLIQCLRPITLDQFRDLPLTRCRNALTFVPAGEICFPFLHVGLIQSLRPITLDQFRHLPLIKCQNQGIRGIRGIQIPCQNALTVLPAGENLGHHPRALELVKTYLEVVDSSIGKEHALKNVTCPDPHSKI